MANTKKLAIADLRVGMYVTEIESDSTGVRVKAGGKVSSDKLLKQLHAQGVRFAHVDFDRSDVAKPEAEKPQEAEPEDNVPKRSAQKAVPMKDAINKAQKVFESAKRVQKKIVEDIHADRDIDIAPIEESINGVMESVFSNKNAMMFMSRVKDKDSYQFEHATNVTSYVTAFCSSLNYDEALIKKIATGTLLKDLGNLLVDDKILQKKGKLTPEELKQVKKHVYFTTQIFDRVPGISEEAKEIGALHHERLDGSGYPNGHTGAKLSQAVRIVAIADSYDAMISDRPYRKAMTSTQAFKVLLKSTALFDGDLVQQFIKLVGIHPIGSLVKLRSGKLGVVYKENLQEPLKPVVACFYNSRNGMHMPMKMVDLAKPMIDDEIEKAIKPEEFRVDLDRFMRDSLLA